MIIVVVRAETSLGSISDAGEKPPVLAFFSVGGLMRETAAFKIRDIGTQLTAVRKRRAPIDRTPSAVRIAAPTARDMSAIGPRYA